METLLFEKKENVGVLTVNRPDQLNALNRQLIEELMTFLTRRLKEEKVRALILTGSGEKAFVAGADIKEMKAMNHLDMLNFCDLGQRVCFYLEHMDLVTIAAVNGFALGGGLELALGCDFVYASEKAKLGLPEVTLGLTPGFGGTQRLARTVNSRRAKELVFTGKMIKAQEAFEMGLVNKICPPDKLLEECLNTANATCKNGPVAVVQAKRAINYGANVAMREGLELEKQCCVTSFATDDRIEGMTAFIEKRSADFKGK